MKTFINKEQLKNKVLDNNLQKENLEKKYCYIYKSNFLSSNSPNLNSLENKVR